MGTLIALVFSGVAGEVAAKYPFGEGVSLSAPDADGWVHIRGNGREPTSTNDESFNLIKVTDGDEVTFDNPLKIDQHLAISRNQFSINASGGTINITNDLDFKVTADSLKPGHWQAGTYALYASGGTLNITGKNISVEVRHDLNEGEQIDEIGANVLYLTSNSHGVIGQAGGTTRLWALAGQPDLISAKKGSSIVLNQRTTNLSAPST